MREGGMELTFWGSRGSVPVTGKEYERYGGATACVRILAGNEEIYLDAGSGIVRSVPERDTNLSLLLTHLHLDHVQGLPFFVALGEKERRIALYAEGRSGYSAREALDRLFSPPFWPARLKDYPARIAFLEPEPLFTIGDVQIRTMSSCHPGGSTIYKLTYNGRSFVYATDFEHTEEKIRELIAFSKDTDLLIYDGQYTSEDYEQKRGYGHSTPFVGQQIARGAHVGRLVITHHDPRYTDEYLMQIEQTHPGLHYIKDGEVLLL